MNQYTRINCWLLFSLLFCSFLFFFSLLFLSSHFFPCYLVLSYPIPPSYLLFLLWGVELVRPDPVPREFTMLANACHQLKWYISDVCAEDYYVTTQLTTAYGTLLSKLYPLKLNCLWNYICSVTRVLCSREKNLRVVFS